MIDMDRLKSSVLWAGKDGYDSGKDFATTHWREYEEAFNLLCQGARKNRRHPKSTWRLYAEMARAAARSYAQIGDDLLLPLLAAFDAPPRILEVGCGCGINTVALMEYGNVVTVDVTRVRLEQAVLNWSSIDVEVDWAVDDGTKLSSVQDRSMDVVVTVAVMQHLVVRDKLRMIEAIKRVLAPGGVAWFHEELIRDQSLSDAEKYYSGSPFCHMVPLPQSIFVDAFAPLSVEFQNGPGNRIAVRSESCQES